MKKKFNWKVKSNKKYNIIYADPPWKYGGSLGPESHYPCVPIKDIYNFPIDKFADENCALFLWVTFPILPDAIKTLEKWGFRYTTVAFTWIKTNRKNGKPFVGLGGWTRSNAEICLLGFRGRLKRQSRCVRQVIISQLREHSRKPDEIRDRIVELLGDLPRIELFARQGMNGWDSWGNQIDKFNQEDKNGIRN